MNPETEVRGLIFNIMRFSIHDGPGIRTTVFLKGCPLRCWWCHNPESQSARPEILYFEDRCLQCGDCIRSCPNCALELNEHVMVHEDRCQRCGQCSETCVAVARELAGRWMSIGEVVKAVECDRVFFEESQGGVTVSGGEPLQQAQFAEILLAACQQRGIHTTLDTCGYGSRDMLVKIAPHVDLFLYDLKIADPDKHRAFTGRSNDLILENLGWLAQQRKQVIVRVPVIPGMNDDDENLAGIAQIAGGLGLDRIDLLPYHHIAMDKYRRLHQDYRLNAVLPPSAEQMQAIAARLTDRGFGVRIGG